MKLGDYEMDGLIKAIEQTIFGQEKNIRLLLTAFLAGGHVLLEGVPGLGKTKLVKTLAASIGCEFRRLQFTPDMMPSDITGNVVFNLKENDFQTIKGPIFTHILLADEINRTPPKTQSALLEGMEENHVTLYGTTYPLPIPFFVVATQNPIEYEGTYPLPEAQLDRFLFKLTMDYPNALQEVEVLKHSIPARQFTEDQKEKAYSLTQWNAEREKLKTANVEKEIIDYIVKLVRKTRETPRILLGASPRAGISILNAAKAWAYLEAREFVTPDDVKIVLLPALRHRIKLTPQAELEGASVDQIVQELMASVPVPR
jgi:MoxR-like ATPase